MIDQSIKTSPSLLPRKKELTNIRRAGLMSNVGSRFNKSKPEWLTDKKIFDSSIAPESAEENAEKLFDHEKTFKGSELTDLKQETSEEVQEFIKQVSNFIKKKNFNSEAAKNDGSTSIGSIQFNGMGRKPLQKKHPETLKLEGGCEILPIEKVKSYMRHPKLREKLHSTGTFEKEPGISKEKQTMISSARRRDQNEKFFQKKVKKIEPKTIKKPTNEYFHPNMNDETEYSRNAEVRLRNKKRRKSEIPLRKNRTYPAKPVSWLLNKPLSETESSISFDFSPDAKPFSPQKETNICSYMEMKFNMNHDYDNLSNVDSLKEYETNKSYDEHTPTTTQGSQNCLTSMTLVNSDSANKLVVDEPSSGGAEKVLELEKVTTSSFTTFRADNIVLRRLESFHKQNINSKEAKIPLKPKALVPKASFNSLAGKSSKKNVSSRLSSKGNKPGLKIKIKKNQLRDPGEPKRLRKCCEEKMKVLALEKNQNLFFKFPRSEILKRDDVQQHRKVTSSRAKISLNHIRLPKDEEKCNATDRPVRSFTEPEKEIFENTLIEKNQQNGNIKSSPFFKDFNNEAKSMGNSVNDIVMPVNIDAENNENKSTGEKEDEDEDGWSSKTITFDEEFSNDKLCAVELHRKDRESNLLSKGKSLNFSQDEPPEKPNEAESLAKNKKMLKIDLSSLESTEPVTMENETQNFSFDWNLPKIEKNIFSSNEREIEDTKEKEKRTSCNGSVDSLPPEVTEEPVLLNAALNSPRRSCSSLNKNLEFTPALKAIRKKKIRSDAGDRRLRTPSSSSVVSFDMSLQNITKTDASNLRSNLKKPLVREEMRDVFEDVAAIKLKRRNSEPLSFRGYIWKCADFPRSHKASVSSMASSLRHLNTDEIDDFILWEAVPQKMTSCWEMSLYHSKRPWSVLSCSVFKNNRNSSTPGLILENLRNQGINTSHSPTNQNERANNHKQNPFDVEPSIAQKNIDIRNWLAALNFSTLPSTSNDILNEDSSPVQSAIDPNSLNRIQVQANPKRRKVLPNFKFSDETSEKKLEDQEKFEKTIEWEEKKCEELTDLMRRKSGGYVTREHLNSDHSLRRPNVTVNFCVYSKSAEESAIVVETSDKSSSFEPRKYKSVEVTSPPEVSISATIIGAGVPVGDHIIKKCKKEKGQAMAKKDDTDRQFVLTFSQLTIFLKQELNRFVSDGNIWKYLFIFTLILAVAHCCFLKAFVCHN